MHISNKYIILQDSSDKSKFILNYMHALHIWKMSLTGVILPPKIAKSRAITHVIHTVLCKLVYYCKDLSNDTILPYKFYCNLISRIIIIIKTLILLIFPHKCYNSGAIILARIYTIYVRNICGVQSVIARFQSKFRLILDIDC